MVRQVLEFYSSDLPLRERSLMKILSTFSFNLTAVRICFLIYTLSIGNVGNNLIKTILLPKTKIKVLINYN